MPSDEGTSPETNSSHLQIGGWKTNFLLGWPMFSGYVSSRECNEQKMILSPSSGENKKDLKPPSHCLMPQKWVSFRMTF